VRHLALVRAINEAWGVVALLTLAALMTLPFARAPSRAGNAVPEVFELDAVV